MIRQCENDLTGVMKMNGNETCMDCNISHPDWVSLGFATLLCINCAGVHRKFGTHITLVRSLHLDNFTSEQIQLLLSGGNQKFRDYLYKSDIDCIDYNNPKVLYYREIRLTPTLQGTYNNTLVSQDGLLINTPPNSDSLSLPSVQSDVVNVSMLRSSIPFDTAVLCPDGSIANKAATVSSNNEYTAVTTPVLMRGENTINNMMNISSPVVRWTPDDQVNQCMICSRVFTFFIRKHHCRRCGKCVCEKCAPSDNVRPILEWQISTPVRHCYVCFKSPLVQWT